MQETTWRFLDTGKGSAVFNMALDEAITRMVETESSPPTFRLYGWAPPAITVGYSQNLTEEIDLDLCRADGIDVTRRPTGGRAVFHDDEIAYSVAAPVNNSHFGGSIMETYRSISLMLNNALNAAGVETVIDKGRRSSDRLNVQSHRPCFTSSARYEITCMSKKIIGSAQRRFGTVFLQHGSILTGPGQERIIRYQKDRSRAEKIAEKIAANSTNLKALMNATFSEDRIKKSLLDSLKITVDGNVVIADPSNEVHALAEKLSNERYGSKGWILGNEK